MSILLHITQTQHWEQAQHQGSYSPPSLDMEGFIHCSHPHQLLSVANTRFRGCQGLLLLCIDPQQVTAEVRDDPVPDEGHFPHIYGPLNLDAVTSVLPFEPDGTGFFHWPDVLSHAYNEPG